MPATTTRIPLPVSFASAGERSSCSGAEETERPSSDSTDARRVAEPSLSAHNVTDQPSPTREPSLLAHAARSASGSHAFAPTVGVAGPSATGKTLSIGAIQRSSNRS